MGLYSIRCILVRERQSFGTDTHQKHNVKMERREVEHNQAFSERMRNMPLEIGRKVILVTKQHKLG